MALGKLTSRAGVWDRDSPKLMGDIRQRPKVVELLGNANGKMVLDAGCGEGYLTRLILEKNPGADVYGIDKDRTLLELARKKDREIPSLSYFLGDITNFSHLDLQFDAVTCVGVIHRLNPSQVHYAFENLANLTRNRGKLVLSTPHPYLFEESSLSRRKGPCWVKYSPVSEVDSNNIIGLYKEKYFNSSGQYSTSFVYRHSAERLEIALEESGFRIMDSKTIIVEKEDLLHSSWGTKSGYPAYLIIEAVKGGNS